MKILLINNYSSESLKGGVENYLFELVSYAKNIDGIEFNWYGNDVLKTNWIQKFYNYKLNNYNFDTIFSEKITNNNNSNISFGKNIHKNNKESNKIFNDLLETAKYFNLNN